MAYKSGHIYVIDHEPTEEELATFSKPVEFYICKPDTTEFYSILYTKTGNKFVEKASEIKTGFIKIGEIVQNGNQITIGVHPSGFNHWRINGVDVTSDQQVILQIDPVADSEFRTDWIVGNAAGGIFILQGTAGKFPIKPNPLDYPALAFFSEIQVTPDVVGGLVELNLSDVFTGNAADQELDIKEASAEQRGTMSSTHFSKLEGINPSIYATVASLDSEIVNRAAGDNNLQGQVNVINARTTSVVDKMLHYWDATAGKWLSSGVAYLSGRIGIGKTDPSEMLDVNGRAKANSLVLAADIGTAVPNEFGRKSGFLCVADASGVLRYYSAGSRFVYTPTGNFTLSALKAAVEAEKMLFNSIVIYVNIGSNNYTCTIDIGAANPNTCGVIKRSGSGSLSFATVVGRTLDSGINNITILNGNQKSFCVFELMDKDYVTIKNY